MSEEAAFLRAILVNPLDEAPRLVYADWLDERADPKSEQKATFLRDLASLSTKRGKAPRSVWRRLTDAAMSLEPQWMAVVVKTDIEACAPKFRSRCPKRWEKVHATDDVRVRVCGECRKTVHYCDTLTDALNHTLHGRCVAVDIAIRRKPNDLALYRPKLGHLPAHHQPAIEEFLSERDDG